MCSQFQSGRRTLVDVGAVGLLARLGALLLVARGGGLLASILLLGSLGGSGGSLSGGLLVSGLGRHFCDGKLMKKDSKNQCQKNVRGWSSSTKRGGSGWRCESGWRRKKRVRGWAWVFVAERVVAAPSY